jgi:LysM repeat protein
MTNEWNSEEPQLEHEKRHAIVRKATAGVAALAVAAAGGAIIKSHSDTPQPMDIRYPVQDGDTLSTIAQNICIDKSVEYPVLQERITELRIANELNTDQIHEGQILKIPHDICE